jgi:hypothetical protein
MTRRLAALCFAILTFAVPAFARVLSYAPYSNRPGEVGFHERTSRHFVLVESTNDTDAFRQLVLYDTTGAQEPRVVFPMAGGNQTWIQYAALYERKDSPSSPPMLLVTIPGTMIFSADGGVTWKELTETRGKGPASIDHNDFGGPTTHGLTNPIRMGTDATPFIVTYGRDGIIGITATGEVKTISSEIYARVLGQNRAGTRLLIRGKESIEIVDLNGGNRKVLVPLQSAVYSGWITADGSAYIQMTHNSGRFLFLHRNGQSQLISGPYGVTPPALGTWWPDAPWYDHQDPMNFFAVPTADFEGAWLLQRGPGKPTTLSRHTLAAGTETMWSDVSGPAVEALIAGDSGQTLLVQVHRDRSVQMQRMFIDPALAVWRVGEPMPRRYDELYLNEEWDKGFVHVDVDRLSAGEPFVFSSGTVPRFEGDISSPVGGGGDVGQEWGVVRGSLRQQLVLPGVARLNGAFGSRWLTDVTIYNPLETPQNVVVLYMELGEEVVQNALFPITQRVVTVTLQPREIRFIPDALHALFGIDGGGAMYFTPSGDGVNVVGRTYSVKPTGGTFGFGMQAIDFFNAASARFPVTFAGAFPGPNFRTNVLLTDTSGNGTEATLNAFGVSGPLGSTLQTIHAPPGGILQFNGIGQTLGLFSNDAGGLMVRPTRGTAIATVVSIDNRTNDPTYFPPDVRASNLVRAIPVIGHVDGANGSHFRSDVYLFNPTSTLTTVTLEAKQWDGPAVKLVSFTLLPHEARIINDALPTLFGMSGLARLRYWSDTFTDGVRVTSRTYTIDDGGATYGSLIPTLNNFQIAGPGDRLEILGISGGSGFRTNLGLVELAPGNQTGPAPTSVRIHVLNQKLEDLDTFIVTVPPAGGMQVNDIFGSRGITPPEAAMLVVEVLNGGIVGSYATLVDNVTNDSTYLGAQLAAREN